MRIQKKPGAFAGALALALVALLVPAAGATPGTEYFGTNIQPMLEKHIVTPDRWGAFLGAQAHDGLTLARFDGAWGWAEPNAPSGTTHTYVWDPPNSPGTSLDKIVTAMVEAGVRPVADISTAPPWAGAKGVEVTPDHYSDMAAFAGAFAARYGTGGSFWAAHPELPQLPVRDYEIWTEANSTNSWSGTADPADYVAGLRLVSPAIRKADPAGHVLASLGWQDFENFTKSLYASGMQGLVDGIAFHPYAPSGPDVVDLVRRLRAVMVGAGDGSLPIDVTEIGYPAAAPGSPSGLVSDQTRAARLTLAGDALARSDCGVQDFLVYANVGSESSREQLGEGYMGIYHLADASSTITAQALRDAESRWRQAPGSGLVICGAGATPPAKLLPLALKATTTPTCATGTVTYQGNTIDNAQLLLHTADGRTAEYATGDSGMTQVCIPNGPAISSYTLQAVIPKIAASPILTCPVASGTCTGPAPAPAPTAVPCSYRLAAALARGHGATRVRARLTCGTQKLGAVKEHVYLQRRGHKKRTLLRTITLRAGKLLTFKIKPHLHRGDRVVIIHSADKRHQIPRLIATAKR